MATNTLEKEQISWDLQDNQEKLRVLTQLTIDGQISAYSSILAGNEDIGIKLEDLIHLNAGLSADIAQQIALITKSKPIAEALIEQIKVQSKQQADKQESLVELTLKAKSVHIRKNAVMAISDQNALIQLKNQLAGKDKTVSKILEQKLAQSSGENESAAKIESETEKQAPAKTTTNKPKQNASNSAVALNPAQDLPAIEQELEKLSHKNTTRLNSLQSNLGRMRSAITDSDSALNEELNQLAQNIHASLQTKLEKNKAHQEALKQSTEDLLANLKTAMDEGRSHDALPTWDKIQGNISNTSGKLRSSLQEQANEYKTKLNELRDWKIFASAEKKKELISQMQHLLDSKMHASDKSKHISHMHNEWKSLGRSSQNEELWQEFKKLSDAAYEPCKAYFKQRKQLMATNLKARREICEKLDSELTAIDQENVNISNLNKLLHSAEQEWKKYAPVEQSKIKSLQKKYYSIINQLRKLRKNALKSNGNQKQAYITEARQLAEVEDQQMAMNEAKRLQKEWKTIGPTSYKEDKKYWEEFRAACDKIFEKRNQEAATKRDELIQLEAKAEQILNALEKIHSLNDEELRSARGEYNDLQQSFSGSINPKLHKQQKKFIERFNNIKRKVDMRFKSLPDKKWQDLKNSIVAKTQLLQNLENELFSCKDKQQFADIKTKLQSDDFNDIANCGKDFLNSAMQERVDGINKSESLDELLELAKESEKTIRSLCIDLEIRGNTETPNEDQALRMQIQLDQLKQGFGQAKPSYKENLKHAQNLELQAICIGPLEQKVQDQLVVRLSQAAKKIN